MHKVDQPAIEIPRRVRSIMQATRHSRLSMHVEDKLSAGTFGQLHLLDQLDMLRALPIRLITELPARQTDSHD
jgi:hypothetical protein